MTLPLKCLAAVFFQNAAHDCSCQCCLFQLHSGYLKLGAEFGSTHKRHLSIQRFIHHALVTIVALFDWKKLPSTNEHLFLCGSCNRSFCSITSGPRRETLRNTYTIGLIIAKVTQVLRETNPNASLSTF